MNTKNPSVTSSTAKNTTLLSFVKYFIESFKRLLISTMKMCRIKNKSSSSTRPSWKNWGAVKSRWSRNCINTKKKKTLISGPLSLSSCLSQFTSIAEILLMLKLDSSKSIQKPKLSSSAKNSSKKYKMRFERPFGTWWLKTPNVVIWCLLNRLIWTRSS